MDAPLLTWDISDVNDNLKEIKLEKNHQNIENTRNIDTSTAMKAPSTRKVGFMEANRLLPLFEAT